MKAIEIDLTEVFEPDELGNRREAYVIMGPGEPDEMRYKVVSLEWFPWVDGAPPEIAFRVECGPA